MANQKIWGYLFYNLIALFEAITNPFSLHFLMFCLRCEKLLGLYFHTIAIVLPKDEFPKLISIAEKTKVPKNKIELFFFFWNLLPASVSTK